MSPPYFLQTFIALAALATVALARPDQPRSYEPEPSYGPASYDFNWAVQDDYSKNNYGQQEARNGDKTTGSYYVALPDGRTQKVTYSVDGYGGYQAEVTYEGEAQYPPAQKSSYKPAEPKYPSF